MHHCAMFPPSIFWVPTRTVGKAYASLILAIALYFIVPYRYKHLAHNRQPATVSISRLTSWKYATLRHLQATTSFILANVNTSIRFVVVVSSPHQSPRCGVSHGAVYNDSTVSVISFDIADTLKLKVGLALPASAALPPKRRLDE